MEPATVQTIHRAMDSFLAVQQYHLRELGKGLPDSWMAWQQDRQTAFAGLQEQIGELKDTGLPDKDGADLLLAKMQEIIDGEAELENAVREQREELAGKLSAMRKGKNALHGYGSTYSAGPGARFLSSKS